MKILSFYNIKGGVGKTASAINVAFLAGIEKKKVLLWDLDPQGAATYYFCANAASPSWIKGVIKGKDDIREYIQKTKNDFLDIIPSDFSFRLIDIYFNDIKKSEKHFLNLFKKLGKMYDYVILDCPPGITLLSENILEVSDLILVPTIPTPLSMRTQEQLILFCKKHDVSTKKLVFFLSMVEIKKKLHLEHMEYFYKTTKQYCKTYIPFRSEIERMGIYRSPVVSYMPKSSITSTYKKLWEEIKGFIKQ
ncbi:MAG: ParA family protein [Bacteroidota bacterium]